MTDLAVDVLHDHPITTKSKPYHHFTKENARRYSENAHAARKAKKLAAELAKALPPPPPDEKPYASAIETLERHMRRIDALLDKASDRESIRDLTAGRERIFKQWAHLAGIAGPGNFKPARQRTRSAQVVAMPEPQSDNSTKEAI